MIVQRGLGVWHALPDHLRNGNSGIVEHYDSAEGALDRVRVLLKAGLPNIRVLDEIGRPCSLTEIEEPAEDEADGV